MGRLAGGELNKMCVCINIACVFYVICFCFSIKCTPRGLI